MENNDVLKKYLAHNDMVRVFVLDATYMVSSLRDIHNMSNVVTAAVGRTLIASTILSCMLKNKEDRLTVMIKGEGKLKNIVVCGNNSLNMKAYGSNPYVEIPKKPNGKLDVSGVIGKGKLQVIKDLGLKEPYIGMCELVSSEIAEDFAYYLVTSEQTPCAVSLGVSFSKDNKVNKACGYIIEPLPDCDDNVISLLEEVNSSIKSVTTLFEDLDDIDIVAKTISADNNIRQIEERKPHLRCDCSNDRIEKTIISLGKKEVEDILKENNDRISLRCDFCNKEYQYTKDEVMRLFKNKEIKENE